VTDDSLVVFLPTQQIAYKIPPSVRERSGNSAQGEVTVRHLPNHAAPAGEGDVVRAQGPLFAARPIHVSEIRPHATIPLSGIDLA